MQWTSRLLPVFIKEMLCLAFERCLGFFWRVWRGRGSRRPFISIAWERGGRTRHR